MRGIQKFHKKIYANNSTFKHNAFISKYLSALQEKRTFSTYLIALSNDRLQRIPKTTLLTRNFSI